MTKRVGLVKKLNLNIGKALKMQNADYAQGYIDGLKEAQEIYSRKNREYHPPKKE